MTPAVLAHPGAWHEESSSSMRVQLTRRTRAFSVLGNDVLQDPGISYPALGVLVHLLSLPDGARIDVRVLADRRAGLGRQGVANALDELVKADYYVRRTVRDSETGRIRTETLIRDTRHDTGSTKPPLPAPTGTGRPAKGAPGTFPDGKKTPGKKAWRTSPKTGSPPASPNRTAEPSSPKDSLKSSATPARCSPTASPANCPTRAGNRPHAHPRSPSAVPAAILCHAATAPPCAAHAPARPPPHHHHHGRRRKHLPHALPNCERW